MIYQKEQNFKMIPNNKFLQHYGTPRMKWGVRRYQYKDGSLTPLGYKHYGYGTKDKLKKAAKFSADVLIGTGKTLVEAFIGKNKDKEIVEGLLDYNRDRTGENIAYALIDKLGAQVNLISALND